MIPDFTSDFVPYVALAVILFAIRETNKVSNKWIPLLAVFLGVLYAFWETGVKPEAFVQGCKYALLGIGTVAGIKYFLASREDNK
ncbi:phage holin family protein [Fictibacillus fluitans]|uniref:Phage holin family protein n=1 Tax=Fictibacillus fluitans TaxID=3058422 RepID=A0ABT8HX24_9BACL|nr:phage holin family protein [Fictibacillus sp. NE201]MDN4525309.1 phage holin family protein [Fictibacillus sp. NE201]